MRIVGGLERSNKLVGTESILMTAGNVCVCVRNHHIRADAVSFHRVDVVVEVVAVSLAGFSREVRNIGKHARATVKRSGHTWHNRSEHTRVERTRAQNEQIGVDDRLAHRSRHLRIRRRKPQAADRSALADCDLTLPGAPLGGGDKVDRYRCRRQHSPTSADHLDKGVHHHDGVGFQLQHRGQHDIARGMTGEHANLETVLQCIPHQPLGGQRSQTAAHVPGSDDVEIPADPARRTTVLGDGDNAEDHLWGGDGDDLFVFSVNGGDDWVEDFTSGEDTLDVSALGFADFADLLASTSDVGGNATIDYGNNDEITLVGVATADLSASDFLF